ncbi:hypothetical protein ACS0TY_001108 [Phlomoides rotata]
MEAPTEVESEIIDVDDIDEGEKESCLVGRLITEEHWNPSNLIEAITKAWKPKHGMSSRVWEESKLILFSFDDVMDRDWVLKNQPWQFKGSLFAIQKFTLLPSNNVTIEHASFWARLYDVPFSCLNEISLRLFTKQIGILESVEKSDEDSVGTFIRFKVSINITKPLMRGISIRVKGKHLWLPLKYESLPIYCFSCGTIGHGHKNCPSYDRNLKYSTCKLREETRKKTQEPKDAPTTLPYDIIENILSRLPAKYLLRFKVVCKLWEAMISDPTFAETHFQQYNNSSSQNLLAWEKLYDFYQGLYVAEIPNDHFQFVSGIQHSRKYSLHYGFLCNCDERTKKFGVHIQ